MADRTLTTRRKLLTTMPVVAIAAITTQPVFSAPPRPGRASAELRALVDAHKAVYAALVEAIRVAEAGSNEPAKASRAEEKALLAVCAFPARSEGDRRAKARYLLGIEARGELDLRQHMRAVLRSTMA
jgi:hypothetical protein